MPKRRRSPQTKGGSRQLGDDGFGFGLDDAEAALGRVGAGFAATYGMADDAHAALEAGQSDAWRTVASNANFDELSFLLPHEDGSHTLLGLLEEELAEDPTAADDPAFATVKAKAEGVAGVVGPWRDLIAATLTPHRINGKAADTYFKAPDVSDTDFYGVATRVVEKFEPMVAAADQARGLALGAAAATGEAAREVAVMLLAGPLSYGFQTPEFWYVHNAFEAAGPSPAVKAQLGLLLGREDHAIYTDEWFGDDDEDAMIDDLAGRSRGANGWTDTNAFQGPARPGPSTPGATSAAGPGPAIPEQEGRASTETRLSEVNGSAKVAPGTAEIGGGFDATRTEKGGRDQEHANASATVKAGEKISGKATVGRGTSEGTGRARETQKGDQGIGRTEDGRWYGESSVTESTKRVDGSGESTTASVKYGKDQLGGTLSSTDTGKDGSSTTNQIGGSVDTKEGKVAVDASHVQKDADGEVKGGVSGGLNATMKDGAIGAGGNVSVQNGGKKVALSADVTSTVGQPVQLEDGRWQVTISFAMNASVGGSGESKKGSVGASVGGRDLGTRTRLFATEEEAKAFYDSPDRGVAVRTAEDALAMKVGETASQEGGISGKLDGSLKAGPATVSAGAHADQASFSKMERREGSVVRVEVGDKATRGLQGSISAYGVGGGLGHSRDSSESVTVDFDLADAASRRAFELYQRTGQLPLTGGYKVVGDSKMAAATNSRSLSILGMSMSGSRTTGESVTHLDGNRTETNWGTEATAVSIPGLGSLSRSHNLTGWQINEGDNLYQTETQVKASGLDDVKKGLSRGMSGDTHHTGARDKGSNKGLYRLQAAFSEKQMDDLIRRAAAGELRQMWGAADSLDGTRAIPSLERAVRAAGNDRDAQRRALAKWVSDNGAGAMDLIHNVAGGPSVVNGDLENGAQFFVAVDGDEHLTGLKGQLDLELRMTAWDERLAAGDRGPSITNGVKKDLDKQRHKLDYLEKCGELPPNVHAQEYNRTRRNIGLLDALMLRSLQPGEGTPANAAVDPQLALVHKAASRVAEERSRMQDAYEDVYAQRRMHIDGRASYDGSYKASRDFVNAKKGYANLDDAFQQGDERRKLAKQLEDRAGQDLAKADLTAIAALNFKAAAEYRFAAEYFKHAHKGYADLQRQIDDIDGAHMYFQHAGKLPSLLPGQ